MAGVYTEMEGCRLQNLRQAVEWMAANGPLRIDLERAAETLWAMASPDVARLLCERRGWTDEQYADWLEDLLTRSIFPWTVSACRATPDSLPGGPAAVRPSGPRGDREHFGRDGP